MRKPAFCICENKGADQLYSYQCLCFHYKDGTNPLVPKSKISNLDSSVAVQSGLCRIWWETLDKFSQDTAQIPTVI